MDGVSSVGAEKMDLEAWNVAFCTTSAGKAICSLPGLGIIMARTKDIEALEHIPARTAYLNLYNLYKYAKNYMQTPNTPAVHLFYAFDQALSNIHAKGIEKWRAEIRRKAEILRLGMKQMGLEFLIDESYMSASLTTVMVPTHTTIHELKTKLKEKNIVIYNGKGPFLDRVFQVGNIGELTDAHVKMFLRSLKRALGQLETPKVNKIKVAKKHSKITYPNIFLPISSKSVI